MILVFLLLSGVLCSPCLKFSNEIYLILGSEVEVCSPFRNGRSCAVDRSLPEGLTLKEDCRIVGFTKMACRTEYFTLKSYNNDKIMEKKLFSLGVYEKLEKCGYSDGSGVFMFPKDITSSLSPPKCNVEIEKCYSYDKLPKFVKVYEDGSILLSNPIKSELGVNVICYNKVSEYKMKLKINIIEVSENGNDKVRNLQSNIIQNIWEFSNNRQPNDIWMIGFRDKKNWIVSNSFPPKSKTTRYYRNTFTITNIKETGPPLLKITFNDGILIYVNGKEIYRRNFFSGGIDTTTTSRKKEKRNMEISIPLTVIKEGINYIGIEVHSYLSNPLNQVDSLSCTITLSNPITTTPTQISTIDTVTQYYQSASGKEVKEVKDMNNIFSIGSGYIEYYLTSLVDSNKEFDWFPFNITYSFNNNKAFYFNQFSISGCSDDEDYHPKHIRIYGSTDSDGIEWELLYENENLGLTGKKCTTILSNSLPSDKSYERYKLEIISINDFPTITSAYIKFKLFVVNVESLPMCKSDSFGFSSVYAGGTSIVECGSGFMKRKCLYASVTNTAKWSDDIDKSKCYNENVYVSTYPNITKTYEFDKEISSITPKSQYVSISGKILKVNSNIETVQRFEVILSDLTEYDVYVSAVRDVGKCSYGVDSIRIYPIEIDLELLCYHKPSYISVYNLPTGLNVDKNGRIYGMISDPTEKEEYTTVITYIIDKKYELEIKWNRKKVEMSWGLEFVNFAESGQDGMDDNGYNFHNSELKDIWSKFENGKYKIATTEALYTTNVKISDSKGECLKYLWKTCQNGIARMRGYVKIDEDGEYTFYGKSDRQKFALKNYEDELYNTNGFFEEGSYKVTLKKGYYAIGYLSWYGSGSSEFQAYLQKTGGNKELLDDRIFRGGFVISHLSYNVLFVELKKYDDIFLKPTFNGIPSEWEISPEIKGLSIKPDGTIEGYTYVYSSDYKIVVVKSVSKIDICEISTEFQLHLFDKYSINQNGLKVKYYYFDAIDVDNTINISTLDNKHFRLERFEENIYHEKNDNLWNDLPEELSYSFIAHYRGYFNNKLSTKKNITISLECHDYCRLNIEDKYIECKGYGYHKKSVEMNLDNSLYDLEIIYAKGNEDKTKLLKIYYSIDDSEGKEIPESLYLFNAEYPVLYNPIKTHYYKDVLILIQSPIKSKSFSENIANVKYSISPSLPPGMKLNENDGSIEGISEIIDEDRNYTIRIDFRNNKHFYSSFSFSVLPKIEPIIEYPINNISIKAGENIELTPSNMKCEYINAAGLPAGINIDKDGKVYGISKYSFDKDVDMDCFTYKKKSVSIHITIISDETLPPTTIIPTTETPTSAKPTIKMVELFFFIHINITTLTANEINIIEESLKAILEKLNIDMSITKVKIEMMKRRMRILSEYKLRVIIETPETESTNVTSTIKYLAENEGELQNEIKNRVDKDSDLYNSKIEIEIEKNDTSPPPENEEESNNNVVMIIIIVVAVVVVLVCCAITCRIINRKNVKR